MKANHNKSGFRIFLCTVVVNISSSKNESKSQHLGLCATPKDVVVNISSSKNESKSQRVSMGFTELHGCCKYQ